jgi:hypothetical protein
VRGRTVFQRRAGNHPALLPVIRATDCHGLVIGEPLLGTIAPRCKKDYGHPMADDYEFADDDPEYADEPETDDDSELAEFEPTDPKDMPPDEGDIGRLELPEDEG